MSVPVGVSRRPGAAENPWAEEKLADANSSALVSVQLSQAIAVHSVAFPACAKGLHLDNK